MEKKYFYGNEISQYGLENGYVDFGTLAKSFDAVLCNNISSRIYETMEQVSGFIDNSEEIEELERQIYEGEESGDLSQEEIEEIQEKIYELQNEQDETPEVFQWYIVSDNAKSILEDAEQIVYYDDELDIYIWGVTHFGTSWDYVLTSIKIDW